jgi:hypothetical protein
MVADKPQKKVGQRPPPSPSDEAAERRRREVLDVLVKLLRDPRKQA